MIEALLGLVPIYGLYIVGLATFLSCLAMPIPSSLIMLAAGAFIAAGDFSGPAVAGLALAGAVAGDQVGYAMGRAGSARLDRLKGKPAAMVRNARYMTERHGVSAVFLSRWLLSPLGPYVNLVTGAARMHWLRFTLSDLAGEAVWITLYLGAGYVFAGQIEAVADIAANFSGTLAAAVVAVGLGLWLRSDLRTERRQKREPQDSV
ncbi:MAG: DedA family protein [Rhodobacteraceae bacterium]|nr:DedA family protein [Paracoccaceae bacterium]